MLSVGARPTGSRFGGTLLGIGGAIAVVALYVALRGATESPAPAAPAEPPVARDAKPALAPQQAEAPQRSRTQSKTRAAQPADQDQAPLPPVVPNSADPALAAVLAAKSDRSAEGTKTLIANLVSGDAIVVAEAANALVARRATEAIDPLSRISLETAGGSGLSIIDALGRLGGLADDDGKRAAVERLVAMLEEEKRRGGRESPGNLLQIYEALGQTHYRSAAPPLEQELLDGEVPRAPKVVIVKALVSIGEPTSRASLEAALAEQAAQKGSDAFEEEIRQELLLALQEAAEAL